jgi:hypothetical protein
VRTPNNKDGEASDDFFTRQVQDIQQTQADAIEAANTVEGFNRHRSAVIPWLQATGVAQHVQGLRKDQIRIAVSLLRVDEDPVLYVSAEAIQTVLKTAHSWCFDGPECMLNRPCQYALSRFQGPSSDTTGKQRVFNLHKNPATLKNYFAIAPRFLAYLYRITREDQDYFDVEDDSHSPAKIVQMTVG